MKPGRSRRVRVNRVEEGAVRTPEDRVATEEPMEIRLEWREGSGVERETPVAVTMRTPGDDFDLAAGFLLTEGVVSSAAAIGGVRYCAKVSPQEYNVVSVTLSDPGAFDPSSLARNFYITSSCGVCGKASLEAVQNLGCENLDGIEFDLPARVVSALPADLRASQPVFQATGGIHAAAAFDADGRILVSREDVGRHNAVDKVVGALAMRGDIDLAEPNGSTGLREGPNRRRPVLGIVVSGRASFEIMQKAAMAHMPAVVAVGAPSSLAVEFAREFGMTLAGFTTDRSFNTYSRPDRISLLEVT